MWKDLRVTVNGEAFDTAGEIRDGYLYISRKWGSDDQVELHFPPPVRKIYASTHVREDVGCVALMRGPVVYRFEGADNGANLQALAVKRTGCKGFRMHGRQAFRSSHCSMWRDPALCRRRNSIPRNRRRKKRLCFVRSLYFAWGKPRFKTRCASGCTKNKKQKWGLPHETGSPIWRDA